MAADTIRKLNPLLAALPRIPDLETLASHMVIDPMAGLDVPSQDLVARNSWLTDHTPFLCPTRQALRIAMTLYGMILSNYRQRNPVSPQVSQKLWTLMAAAQDRKPSLPALTIGRHSVFVIKGITGAGKSTIIRAFCQMFAAVAELPPTPGADWLKRKQVLYLYVQIPHDSSRGGFLESILVAMDEALGTDYASSIVKSARTIEKLCVRVVALLHAHHIGLLIVDECQLQTLVQSSQVGLLQLFLLKMANSGIPLVFVGNPLAFGWIDEFSQNVRRLYQKPPEFVHPIGADNDRRADIDWNAVFSGIQNYYVLREPIQDPDECSVVLSRLSGGAPGWATILWCNAQNEALFSGRESIGPGDIQKAYESTKFDAFREMARAFAAQDPVILASLKDMPCEYYRKLWEKTAQPGESAPETDGEPTPETDGEPTPEPKQESSGKTKTRQTTEKAKLKAKETRKRKQEEKRSAVKDQLDPSDIRAAGVKDTLLHGFKTMRENYEGKT